MRNVSIKREKSFVGCLVSFQVYVLDTIGGDLQINGKPCRKLGTLKNGKQQTFEVDEAGTVLYIFPDKLSRNRCHTMVTLPAGSGEIALTGKCQLDAQQGNPFVLSALPEGVTAQVHLKQNKVLQWLPVAIVLLCCVAGMLAAKLGGDGETQAQPKEYQIQEMCITLTDAFEEDEMEGLTACYNGDNVVVCVVRDDFSLIEGLESLSKADYAELVTFNSGNRELPIQINDGLVWFDYEWTDPGTKLTMNYYSVVYKSEEAFWLVQMVTPVKKAQQMRPTLEEWARSVTFAEE